MSFLEDFINKTIKVVCRRSDQQVPESFKIRTVDNGFLYKKRYYQDLVSVLNDMNNDIEDYFNYKDK